ncbi:MFS general substrate transporter [Periconia macrospinosa]|uniref:MFS general substrate transporter n=1 Tax=Periconia macrospinosa TaxID=97972 RepID=A0A2V1E177_9PLEO|nr:MFS general substrate transporter [Periconia macrospinosa]
MTSTMTTTTTTDVIELQPFSLTSDHPRDPIPKDQESIKLPHVPEDTTPTTNPPPLSTLQITLTILQLCIINFFGSFSSGIITVGLPTIAAAISIPRSLYLWPSSVYNLTTGACVLIAGSIADILGARHVEVVGVFLLGTFILACGFAQTGVQLVVFRALQGVALAMHIPASVSIISTSIPPGRARNIGFSCLGLSQPLGFSFGMVMSGIMIERIGWRSGYYISAVAILTAAVGSWVTLPKAKKDENGGLKVVDYVKKLGKEVDWIGAVLASAGLSLLSYVLAMISADLYVIRSKKTISFLTVSLVLLIAFPLWMHYRERKGKSALVPNSLWKNKRFACVCAIVALAYGPNNAMTQFSSLYFQEIQNHSALTASLYTLPSLIVGVCINLSVGIFVDRLPAGWLVVGSAILSTFAPLIMAVVNPEWKYYYLELWAQILAPLNADVLYTVALIIVSDSFPKQTQALAGAVFGTVSMFGTSLGVNMCQVVVGGVMGKGGAEGTTAFSENVGDMLKGYRAGFWYMFASTVGCVVVAVVGLRRTGKVGVKKD